MEFEPANATSEQAVYDRYHETRLGRCDPSGFDTSEQNVAICRQFGLEQVKKASR
ncbi:MAG: hypothetical protein ACRD1Y_04785 [Terriglobales bacterium]